MLNLRLKRLVHVLKKEDELNLHQPAAAGVIGAGGSGLGGTGYIVGMSILCLIFHNFLSRSSACCSC